MKISDVCRQYGFDENDLKAFLKEKKLLKETWTSYVIEDSNVDKAVRMYAEFKAQQEEEAAKKEFSQFETVLDKTRRKEGGGKKEEGYG